MTTKYVIELGDDVQFVAKVGVTASGNAYSLGEYKADLEELNSDYINEHFSDLQDDAYQRGLEDGKAQLDRGCEGCEYEGRDLSKLPCMVCSNSRKNCWTAKQTDDEIKVGDEVNWLGTCFIVTRIFQPYNMKEQCDGIDDDGCVYNYVLIDDLEKTGRHFDIDKILDEMKGNNDK